jgi:hypothetical protein
MARATTLPEATIHWRWTLWRQWVLANAVGETVGLGATLLAGTFLLVRAEPSIGAIPAVALGVLAGTLIEGSVVGTSQWLALRRHLPRAGWWVPANALAWAIGMLVIFIGTSFIPATGITGPIALLLLLFVAAAGALVGAVHGLFLVWMVHQRQFVKGHATGRQLARV